MGRQIYLKPEKWERHKQAYRTNLQEEEFLLL